MLSMVWKRLILKTLKYKMALFHRSIRALKLKESSCSVNRNYVKDFPKLNLKWLKKFSGKIEIKDQGSTNHCGSELVRNFAFLVRSKIPNFYWFLPGISYIWPRTSVFSKTFWSSNFQNFLVLIRTASSRSLLVEDFYCKFWSVDPC